METGQAEGAMAIKKEIPGRILIYEFDTDILHVVADGHIDKERSN